MNGLADRIVKLTDADRNLGLKRWTVRHVGKVGIQPLDWRIKIIEGIRHDLRRHFGSDPARRVILVNDQQSAGAPD